MYELADAMFTMEPRPMSRVPLRLVQVLSSCLSMAPTCAHTYAKQVAASVDVHDAIKVVDVGVDKGSVHANIDLLWE